MKERKLVKIEWKRSNTSYYTVITDVPIDVPPGESLEIILKAIEKGAIKEECFHDHTEEGKAELIKEETL